MKTQTKVTNNETKKIIDFQIEQLRKQIAELKDKKVEATAFTNRKIETLKIPLTNEEWETYITKTEADLRKFQKECQEKEEIVKKNNLYIHFFFLKYQNIRTATVIIIPIII